MLDRESKRLRCPNCHSPIRLSDTKKDEVLCPACKSTFRVHDTHLTTTAAEIRQLGKFQLLDRVGVGGFGAVWRARDEELRRTVALKIPHHGLLSSAVDLERFYREARAAAQLRHPGIVTVHEVTTLEGLPVIVSDFIDGVTLRDLLEFRRLTFQESAELVAQVAETLHHGHAMNIVHRDIKPGNIMIEGQRHRAHDEPEGDADADPNEPARLRPLLLDFGLALRTDAEITMTVEGQIIGTLAYMSPEQAEGRGHEADRRTDIYSLGVVLYELLCGEIPFRGTKSIVLHLVQNEEPRAPRRINDKIPRDLETICLKAMAKSPSRRYGTARELADDLRRWLNDEPILARPVGAFERFGRWCQRKPAVASLAALLLLAVLSGFVAVTWQWRKAMSSAKALADQQQALIDARNNAERNELAAREAADREAAANREAQRQTKLAQEQERIAKRHLYAANINLAQDAARQSQISRVIELLNFHRPQKGGEDLRTFEWYYLWQFCNSHQAAMRGHTADITSVCFSPDGRLLATASEDRTIRLWDVASGRVRTILNGHTDVVKAVKFAANGASLASAGADNTVRIWDVTTGRAAAVLEGHQYPVESLDFSGDGNTLVSVAGDRQKQAGEVKVWDVVERKERATLQGHRGAVGRVAFSPDGKSFATATRGALGSPTSAGTEVKIWDAETLNERHTLSAQSEQLHGLVFSPDSQTLFTAGFERGMSGLVILWDVASGKSRSALKLSDDIVLSLASSPDGSLLALGTANEFILYDLVKKAKRRSVIGHLGLVYAIDFSPDGRTVATGTVSGDHAAKLWDIEETPNPRSLTGHTSWVSALAFTSDGSLLATASRTMTPEGSAEIILWNPATGEMLAVQPAGTRDIFALSIAPDGKTLAAGAGDNTVKLWDIESLKLIASLPGHAIPVTGVAFSPDGKSFASADGETYQLAKDASHFDTFERAGQVNLWSVTDQKIRCTLPGHTGPVLSLAYSPGGKLLATLCKDGTTRVWDTSNDQLLHTIRSHGKFATRLAFSPDGGALAIAGCEPGPDESGVVKIYDIATWSVTATLLGHTGPISGMAFSPDSKTLATGSWDRTIRLWDPKIGQQRLIFRNQPSNTLAFSRDGTLLVSGNTDKTVRIWRAASEQEVASKEKP